MNMFNGLNKQEAPSTPAPQSIENSVSVLDQGFYLGETVKFVDELEKLREGKLAHEGFGPDGERIVGIEIEAFALNLEGKQILKNGVPKFVTTIIVVSQDEFMKANPLDKKRDLQDLAKGVSDLLN